MELKPDNGEYNRIRFILLIVPYGIETFHQ